MNLCVRVCVHVYVCVHACNCIHQCLYVNVFKCVPACACTSVCVHVFKCVCLHVHVQVWMISIHYADSVSVNLHHNSIVMLIQHSISPSLGKHTLIEILAWARLKYMRPRSFISPELFFKTPITITS